MTDLKALAYEFLHEAQHSLKSDGYLNPTAIVITPEENLIFDIEFQRAVPPRGYQENRIGFGGRCADHCISCSSSRRSGCDILQLC